MEADPDFTEMTIQAQSWMANLLRFHDPVDVYPELFERFKAVAPERMMCTRRSKAKRNIEVTRPTWTRLRRHQNTPLTSLTTRMTSTMRPSAIRKNPASEDMVVMTDVFEREADGAEEGDISTEGG
ncbi:hypothetical protein LTR35_014335 [Friedmanniomyces endolithicus]|uniref:Uncharacterized protein n=1 Tax=Friedmanniomyces endolithicus TaxID=329885 RepID=A0AAN6FYL4_9PEZI|nr:hypothetical protein LTR35_014335 [Friedmanniomyces endolithicus]KAK0294334.1 hypothetical protein LTS00_006924 [Friedmanniomyces endolithicus]KAK0326809.1 hypothetical protein LTR82_002652 [Friedmanniomyces endolithicus]KAK1013348.1 hypothetical protein LTR54_004255 [Friedmanniomyces endolithicus]